MRQEKNIRSSTEYEELGRVRLILAVLMNHSEPGGFFDLPNLIRDEA
jgi:hypothetical protein